MVIKRKVQASEEKDAVKDIEKKEPVYGNEFGGKYGRAQNHIMEAIKELTGILDDSDDEIAADSIANLSVVLLDLQGNN